MRRKILDRICYLWFLHCWCELNPGTCDPWNLKFCCLWMCLITQSAFGTSSIGFPAGTASFLNDRRFLAECLKMS